MFSFSDRLRQGTLSRSSRPRRLGKLTTRGPGSSDLSESPVPVVGPEVFRCKGVRDDPRPGHSTRSPTPRSGPDVSFRRPTGTRVGGSPSVLDPSRPHDLGTQELDSTVGSFFMSSL